jgi:hypothetical protein
MRTRLRIAAVAGGVTALAGLIASPALHPASASTGDLSGHTTVTNRESVSANDYAVIDAQCPSGDVATGGGFASQQPNTLVNTSFPDEINGTTPDGWNIVVVNNNDYSVDATAVAECASVDS